MIDIHAHILPGIDDGAVDMEETLEMARMAVNSGVTAVVATPHCNVPGIFNNYYDEEYLKVFHETEKALKREGIPLKLYQGMEVFVNANTLKLLSESKLMPMNRSRYMLVEFDFYEEIDYMQKMLEMIRKSGICPIIAHPERYQCVQEHLQLVYQWRMKGYLVQVNKGSLLGRFGRRAYETAHSLLSHNLVTAIASDAHSYRERTPWMLEVYEELSKKYSKRYLNTLFEENPRKICQNQQVTSFQMMRPFDEEL